MKTSINKNLIEIGLRAADSNIYREDKIWSRYSNGKVDIGENLATVIRSLTKALPLTRQLKAFSVGSSAEPQFRILETAFRGGLYLLDIDRHSLAIVKERIQRQRTKHVYTILGDYTKCLFDSGCAEKFLKNRLRGSKMDLITLHHSLYYCSETTWHSIFSNLYKQILAAKGAIHAVLMSATSTDPYSTTWLYNHFAGKYFGRHNNQNLLQFKQELQQNRLYYKSQIFTKTSRVYFEVADFEKLMAVIWMIMLYPNVHKYSLRQREEITEFVYKRFWRQKRPLIQMQDHLAVYRNLGVKGIL